MTFGEKLKDARTRMGLTQKQLAEKIGAKHNSISNWENDQNMPDPNTIELICGILHISPAYLLFDKEGLDTLTLPEREMIRKYNAVDDYGRWTIDTVVGYEYERCFPNSRKETREFPIAYEPAAAGLGNYLMDSGFEYTSVNVSALHPKAKFGVRISGDSMEPDYHDGDIVLVEPMPAIESGELGIFNVDGDAVFKKLIVDHDKRQVILRSLNPEWPDRVIPRGADMHTYGKVVGVLREEV